MSFIEELARVREKVNRVIEEMIAEDKEPFILYEAARHLLTAGGKRLRPFLTLKSCELVGGKEDDALPSAVAIELLHNFTLLHDDIMDKSEKRRGVPTVHTIWGVPMAIDAGDLLFAKVYETVLDHTPKHVPKDRVLRILSSITSSAIEICKGQAYDILFEKTKVVTEEEYFNIVKWKTATLYGTAAKVGAIVGGGTEEEIESLHLYGFNLGIAFQIRDDVLGLVGDEALLRKPVGDDLRQGKRTILVSYALKHCTDSQRDKILAALGNPSATLERLREATEAIRATGAIEYASRRALKFIEKAKAELSPFPDVDTKRILFELADFVVERAY